MLYTDCQKTDGIRILSVRRVHKNINCKVNDKTEITLHIIVMEWRLTC